MQDNIFVARALLADVSSSASNLQTTIEDTSTRMAQMTTTFSGMTENFFRWTWPLLLAAFLVHQLRPKYNPVAISAIGKVLSLFFHFLFWQKCFKFSWVPLLFSFRFPCQQNLWVIVSLPPCRLLRHGAYPLRFRYSHPTLSGISSRFDIIIGNGRFLLYLFPPKNFPWDLDSARKFWRLNWGACEQRSCLLSSDGGEEEK